MVERSRFFEERLNKLNKLKDRGINPFPYRFSPTHHSADIVAKYESLANEERTKDKVVVAGRIVQFRDMGKIAFMHLQDMKGKIQLFFRKDDIGDNFYSLLKLIDLGDIIGAEGTVFRTKAGEISVYIESFEILCKSMHPLPEKYHGLKDPELRYRLRYLDLIMNPSVKDVFVQRSRIFQAMRSYLEQQNFVEVETPALQTIYGGANAKPFITHINAWNMRMYLSISPELYLKRLIVGGFDRVYTICKNFRNEGVDRSHNPEFTMMECYSAYWDYNDVMKFMEEMCAYIAVKVNGTTKVQFGDHLLDFSAPWNRLSMKDAIKEYADIDVDSLSDEELFELRITYNLEAKGDLNRGKIIELLFDELCSRKIIQPTHIINHPKESTPLCKINRQDPALIERFESFIAGTELCNAYSELNDAILQRELLEEQAKALRAGSDEAHPMDEDFVRAMEFGMPPTGGIGIGVDRLVMFLTNQQSIRDVIMFPTMKPEEDSDEKKSEK